MLFTDFMKNTSYSFQQYNERINQSISITCDLIHQILNRNCYDINNNIIDISKLASDIFNRATDVMALNELYYLVSDHCASLITHHPDFNKIASRICVERLHLCTPEKYDEVISYLYNNTDKNKKHTPLVSDKLYSIVMHNKEKIQKMFNFQNDYKFDYFGIRTLERSYLYRIYNSNINSYKKGEKIGQIIERPQHMIMRVALGIHEEDLDAAYETYKLISEKYFTHATPTLFNAGSPRPQLSSCYLLVMCDNIEHIFQTISNSAFISKWAGGIGISISHIRAKGSLIRGTNGYSEGIIPLCVLLDKLGKYVNQGGKRNGSIACFCKDTEVFTVNEGVKKIQDVKIGDLVITHKNRVRPVVQTHKNPLDNRKIYKLEVEKNKDIYVTGNHKFWSCYTKKYKSKKLSLGWNTVEELKYIMENKETTRQACYISIPTGTNIQNKGDYKIDVMDYKDIIMSNDIKELKQTGPNKIISVSKAIDKQGHPKIANSQSINRIWNITDDLANLFGIWLGDGHIRKERTDGKILGIGFTVHKDNTKEIEYIKKICKQVFDCNITQHATNNVIQITVNSRIIGIIFKELFGCYFDGKKLPNMIFGWPKNLVYNLIAGLITTDGHIAKKKCNATLGLSNEKLMNQLYHLCRNNGLDVSFVKYKISGKETCHPYSMSIPLNKEILSRTYKLYNDDRIERCLKKFEKTNDMQKDTFLKIINITETNRNDEYVYTLGVEEDHSYTVEGLIAENCYLEPWHADIFDFCELKKNTGDENLRARDLFLALWVPDLFMKRVLENGMWSLMCPDECPGLVDCYGEDFEKLYIKYEQEGKYKRQVKAIDLWYHILECQIETGVPYMLYKDHANRKSNQKNLGTIKCSNLCAEIIEYTSEDQISVCNLSSICLPTFLNYENGSYSYDFDKLDKVSRVCVRNLNKIIDINYYPTPETRISNLKHRPIGIGVQGFADLLNILELPFGSDKARELNKKIFETIYYACLDESCELAKKYGAYETFNDSPFSKGELQWHLWGLKESDLLMQYDWNNLINKIKTYGTRNSLLTTVMPTASTAQIMGCSESVECYMSNVYTRSTLAGEFSVINENLVKSLIKRNLWSDLIRKKIVAFQGSIQKISEIPQDLKEIYKTAFEVYQKDIITLSAERGPFIDQSQSLNLFMDQSNFDILTNCHLYSWESGLKTGMYYLRSRPAVDPIQFGIDIEELNQIIKDTEVETGEVIQNYQFNDDIEKLIKETEEMDKRDSQGIGKLGKRDVDLKNCERCSS